MEPNHHTVKLNHPNMIFLHFLKIIVIRVSSYHLFTNRSYLHTWLPHVEQKLLEVSSIVDNGRPIGKYQGSMNDRRWTEPIDTPISHVYVPIVAHMQGALCAYTVNDLFSSLSRMDSILIRILSYKFGFPPCFELRCQCAEDFPNCGEAQVDQGFIGDCHYAVKIRRF